LKRRRSCCATAKRLSLNIYRLQKNKLKISISGKWTILVSPDGVQIRAVLLIGISTLRQLFDEDLVEFHQLTNAQ